MHDQQSARNALCIYLSIDLSRSLPVSKKRAGIHSQIGGRESTLRVGCLSLPIQDSEHSFKLIRCSTQAKESSLVLNNICFLPPSMRGWIHNQLLASLA